MAWTRSWESHGSSGSAANRGMGMGSGMGVFGSQPCEPIAWLLVVLVPGRADGHECAWIAGLAADRLAPCCAVLVVLAAVCFNGPCETPTSAVELHHGRD
ncbi:hypothetical protein ACJQWK_00245 [Exserohilum turcicum]